MNADVQGKIGEVGLPATSQTTLRRWLKVEYIRTPEIRPEQVAHATTYLLA